MHDSSFAHGVTIQKTTTDIFTAVGTSSLYRNNLVCKVKKPEVRRRYNKHAHDTEPLHLEIRTNVLSTYHLGFGVPVVAFHPHSVSAFLLLSSGLRAQTPSFLPSKGLFIVLYLVPSFCEDSLCFMLLSSLSSMHRYCSHHRVIIFSSCRSVTLYCSSMLFSWRSPSAD